MGQPLQRPKTFFFRTEFEQTGERLEKIHFSRKFEKEHVLFLWNPFHVIFIQMKFEIWNLISNEKLASIESI